mmetsp:Transcript_5399/g.11149  ORF Transcript_5399/g.11149 Transcript_5399/m.11149 type:complete len:227 (+) Transcript_5399:102-782(+)
MVASLHGRSAKAVARQVRIAPPKQRAQYICVAEQHFDFRLAPVFRRNLLHKLKELVEIHLLELAAELGQKGRAHVYVKVLKAVPALLRDVRVPQPYHAFQVEFAEQQTVHPLEGKLHKLNAHRVNVVVEIRVDAIHEFLESHNHSLDSGLIRGIMILNARQDISQTPVNIGLDFVKSVFLEDHHDTPVQDILSLVVVRQEDSKKRRHQVVDSLDVRARRVPHGPDV